MDGKAFVEPILRALSNKGSGVSGLRGFDLESLTSLLHHKRLTPKKL
jgi:hypothetical protein